MEEVSALPQCYKTGWERFRNVPKALVGMGLGRGVGRCKSKQVNMVLNVQETIRLIRDWDNGEKLSLIHI